MKLHQLVAAAVIAGTAVAAGAADVAVSIGGQISPGVYGRIDIRDGAPPPPVVYAQPVTIVRPAPTVVVGQPLYLHVPPGHARDWAKHCRRYDACGRPVYFVKSAEYEPGYKHKGKGKHDGRGRGRDD
jgi:hypothetical protein